MRTKDNQVMKAWEERMRKKVVKCFAIGRSISIIAEVIRPFSSMFFLMLLSTAID